MLSHWAKVNGYLYSVGRYSVQFIILVVHFLHIHLRMRSPLFKIILFFLVLAVAYTVFSDFVLSPYFASSGRPWGQVIADVLFTATLSIIFIKIAISYEKIMQQREQDFKSLFHENPNIMFVFGVEKRNILAANNAALEKYGYSEKELLKMTMLDLMPLDDKEAFEEKEQLAKYKDGQTPQPSLWKHVSVTGQLFYITMALRNIQFEGEDAQVATITDITHQVLTQEKLQSSEKQLNALINNIDDTVWITDTRGTLVSYNKQFKNLLHQFAQIDVQLLARKNLAAIHPKSQLYKWIVYHNRAMRGEYIRAEEELIIGNTSLYFDIAIAPIYNEEAVLIGIGAICRDITKHKSDEAKIKQQLQQLKTINWVQSHELRRPLSNILGIIEALRISGKSLNEEQELVQMLQTSGEQLDDIIRVIVKQAAKE
jgi:PAS domain S-box-containing protein